MSARMRFLDSQASHANAPPSPGRRVFCVRLATLPLLAAAVYAHAESAEPLPSWQNGTARRAILEFVRRTTDPRSADFVAPAERIAAFDNDGTLWVEKPLPNEVYFTLARVKALAVSEPALARKQPYKAALEGDAAYFQEAGLPAVLELLVKTHSGMSQDAFREDAERFLTEARHPKLDRPFERLVYQPMLELLAQLRANGYQCWICSGGDTDFMRVFVPRTYGIPPERVIGSEFKREVRVERGRTALWRLPLIEAVNDKDGKTVGLDARIGQRPAFVSGNVLSGGDIAMMEYSKGRRGISLQLLINHDDSQREFSYAEKDGASLAAARKHGFEIVSMAKDWKVIFPDPATSRTL
jgi:phosphoserine phosphatase